MLSHAALIDTPGYGAYVGKDGNEHEQRLREWHSKQTLHRTSAADAVVFLVDAALANLGAEDIAFIKSAKGGAPLLSADRTLIILSRADMLSESDRARKVAGLQEEFARIDPSLANLPVLAVSAGIQRILTRLGEDGLRRVYDDSRHAFSGPDDVKLKVECLFPQNYSSLNELRVAFDWAAVKLVLGHLLRHDDFASACQALQEAAGFKELQDALERIFFERTYVLRCQSAIDAALHLIGWLKEVGFAGAEQEQRELRELEQFLTSTSGARTFENRSQLLTTIKRLMDARQGVLAYPVADLQRTLVDVERQALAVVEEGGALAMLNTIYHVRTLLALRKQHFLAVADRGDSWFSRDDVEQLEEHCRNYRTAFNDQTVNPEELSMIWQGVENQYFGDVKQLAALAVSFYQSIAAISS